MAGINNIGNAFPKIDSAYNGPDHMGYLPATYNASKNHSGQNWWNIAEESNIQNIGLTATPIVESKAVEGLEVNCMENRNITGKSKMEDKKGKSLGMPKYSSDKHTRYQEGTERNILCITLLQSS